MTIIQDAWQKFGSKNNVLFIASGSSKPEMDMIRERMTTLLKPTEIKVHNIDSVPFSEFKNYFAGLPIETIVSFYAVTGGVPKFFRLLDKDKDIFENIRNFLSNPTIVAYLDPRIMLNYDFHDPTTYFSIMQVLSMEEAKIGLLAKRLSLRTHNLTSFLDRLRELDLIDRILPGTDENPDKSRKGKYRVIEPFYRFWFRYVYSNQEFLMTNKIDVIINQIKEDYPNLMKRTMISILQEEMRGKNELFDTYTVSNWWEKDRFIEILALGERDVLFGTVYWKDTPITPTELHSLIQESHFVAVPRRIRRDNYLLFSKGGFTKELEKEAKKKTETVVLYSLDNI
jgi:AAA+ ATPase superfamily predicted ATPase